MHEQVYTDCRLILASEVVSGTLVVRDGVFAEVQTGTARAGESVNGAYVLPGLVELHTDHLEANLFPRPGVEWPLESALYGYDRDLLSAGITTACAAVALREVPGQPVDRTRIADILNGLHAGMEKGFLQASHRINLRCELTTLTAADLLSEHVYHPLLATVSLMDHSPGQRQFVSVEKFRSYYRRRYNLSDDDLTHYEQYLKDRDPALLSAHRRRIAALARTHGIPLASHDDATVAHVEEAVSDGVTIAEFPTTELAAAHATEQGLCVLLGGPNVVLDRSHSGNLSARRAAERNALHLLSSDYAPRSLLNAAFLLARTVGWHLADAVATVTRNPARAIGLTDRGILASGQRADFLVVREYSAFPVLEAVYVGGNRVA